MWIAARFKIDYKYFTCFWQSPKSSRRSQRLLPTIIQRSQGSLVSCESPCIVWLQFFFSWNRQPNINASYERLLTKWNWVFRQRYSQTDNSYRKEQPWSSLLPPTKSRVDVHHIQPPIRTFCPLHNNIHHSDLAQTWNQWHLQSKKGLQGATAISTRTWLQLLLDCPRILKRKCMQLPQHQWSAATSLLYQWDAE